MNLSETQKNYQIYSKLLDQTKNEKEQINLIKSKYEYTV